MRKLSIAVAFLLSATQGAVAQQPYARPSPCDPAARPMKFSIPAEQHVGANVSIAVYQPSPRYIYTFPAVSGVKRWAYDLVPAADCVAKVTVYWAEAAYFYPPGVFREPKYGPPRVVQIFRRTVVPGKGEQSDLVGEIGGWWTGGWTSWATTSYVLALNKGFNTQLVFRTKGNDYPIPHVLQIEVETGPNVR
jgi:hypothetical protein